MKILMLTPYIPFPPASGGQVRTLNLLKYLSKHNEVTLVSLYKNDEEKKYSEHLKQFCKKIYICKRPTKPWEIDVVAKAIFTSTPHLLVRNFSQEAKDVIRMLLQNEQFDVIHAETFYVMPHLPETKIPVLLVEQTIEYKVYQHFIHSLPAFIRLFFRLEILKLKFWELYYWKKAALVGTVSDDDRTIIHELSPDVKTIISPNGAGDDMFVSKLEEKQIKKPILFFIGNFSWLQNKEAAEYLIEKIYPKLKKSINDFKIIIAGQNADIKLKNPHIHDIDIIDIASKDSEVLVEKLYKDATLLIVPLFGPGGTRLKILAAMASGVPVISTDTGVSGLEIESNKHVLIANTPDEFVEQIRKVLSNKKLYETLRTNCYSLAKQKYSWKAIASHLEDTYKQLIQKKTV